MIEGVPRTATRVERFQKLRQWDLPNRQTLRLGQTVMLDAGGYVWFEAPATVAYRAPGSNRTVRYHGKIVAR